MYGNRCNIKSDELSINRCTFIYIVSMSITIFDTINVIDTFRKTVREQDIGLAPFGNKFYPHC